MAHYTPIQDDNGADVGYYDYAPPQRSNTSARRYTTVERASGPERGNPTTTLRKASQGAVPTRSRTGYTAETVEVTQTRGDDVLYGSNYARPRRTSGTRTTGNDLQVTTDLREVRVQQAMSRRRLLGVIAVAAAVGLGLGDWGLSTLGDIHQAMQEGQQPATSVAFVCGHGDSVSNPTELHAYIQGNKLNLVELPGGNAAKSHLFQTQSIPSSSDVSKWFVEIVPQQVDAGRYQVQLSVTVPNGPFAQKVTMYWMLIDSGNGYFRPVNAK